MNRCKTAALWICLSCVAVPAVSEEVLSLSRANAAAIDQLVDNAIGEKKLPGAVVMVSIRGQVVFGKAYGHRQISPEVVPMTLDTVFDLASLTKPLVTACCVMKLREQGLIELNDPVQKHLTQFTGSAKEKVTIRHLLVHTSGLIADNALEDYRHGRQAAIEKALALSLQAPPGTRFRYSDVGFIVLGHLVEVKSGQSLSEFAQKHLYKPLNLSDTCFQPGESLRARCAPTEQRDGRWLVGEVHDPRAALMDGIAGHAGLFSTADNVMTFLQMLLRKGTLNHVSVLAPSSVEEMTAVQTVPGGSRTVGWDHRSAYSSNRGKTMTDRAYGHGGFTGTGAWVDPGLDLAVVFLSNRLHPDGQGAVNGLIGDIGTIAADAARNMLDHPSITSDGVPPAGGPNEGLPASPGS